VTASVIAVDILFDASCEGLWWIKKMETESTMLDAWPFALSTRPISALCLLQKKQALGPAIL
jgi:hypothetical protein